MVGLMLPGSVTFAPVAAGNWWRHPFVTEQSPNRAIRNEVHVTPTQRQDRCR